MFHFKESRNPQTFRRISLMPGSGCLLCSLGIAIFFIGMTGCSHAPATQLQSETSAGWRNTKITINYALHQTHRQLLLEAQANEVHAFSLMDGAIIKKTTMDASHYKEYLTLVRDFIEKRRNPASRAPSPIQATCRSPYQITLKNPKDTSEIEGCRTEDPGEFSHLVQEGEFLIYRQK